MVKTEFTEAVSYLSSTVSRSPLLPWRRYQFPIDWTAQFAAAVAAALHLEIGFGDGRYTARRALEHSNEFFVGLEISSASLQRGLRRIKKEGLNNVRLLKVGANFAVQHLFAPRSLSSITVNFPDPWPKARHEKNRLLRRDFFKLAASRLQTNGVILLATDHPDYLEFSKAEARATNLYTLRQAEPPAAVFETKYALKWRSQGKPLYYQVFEYLGTQTPVYPILKRDEIMPHAILLGSLPGQIQFEKQVIPYASGHVILHELARSLGGDGLASERWLIRATIDEEDLRQQVLVLVQRRGSYELIVRIESFGDPIITKVMRGAVHAVTEWLLTLPADIRLKERAY